MSASGILSPQPPGHLVFPQPQPAPERQLAGRSGVYYRYTGGYPGDARLSGHHHAPHGEPTDEGTDPDQHLPAREGAATGAGVP